MRHFIFLILCLAAVLPLWAQDDATETPDDDDDKVLELGESVSGALTQSESARNYLFTAEEGKTVLITLVSEDFDTFLVLKDSDGNELTTDDDSGPGALDSRIGPFVVPEDGEYIISVESYSHHFDSVGATETGSYTLTLTEAISRRIEYTQDVSDELTTVSSEAFYIFRGRQGDLITITMTSQDFNARVRLLHQETLLAASDNFATGTDSAIITGTMLPEDGEYMVAAGSVYTGETGAFTLEVTRTDVTALEYGDRVEARIDSGAPLLYYNFEGSEGDIVDFRVEGKDDFDTTLTINGTDGSQIAYEDDTFDLDPAVTDLILPQDGIYTVLVQPYQLSGTGNVVVTLERGELISLDDGMQEIELTEGDTRETISFAGEAGTTVRLTMTVVEGGTASPNITIMQSQQTLAYTNASNVARQSFDFSVLDDAPVYIQLDNYTYGKITLRFELETVEEEEQG